MVIKKSISEIFLFLFTCICLSTMAKGEEKKAKDYPAYIKALKFSTTHKDSSIFYLQKSKSYFESVQDSSMLLTTLLKLLNLSKLTSDYDQAYDQAWEAITLVENMDDSRLKAEVYHSVGLLYAYSLQSEAKHFLLKALDIQKKLRHRQQITTKELRSGYYNLVLLNIYQKRYDRAYQYLDTCYLLSDSITSSSINIGFFDAEKAHLLIFKKEYSEAEQILLRLEKLFEAIEEKQEINTLNKRYLVIIYSYLGLTYKGLGDRTKAISYFEKSIKAIETYNTHQNLLAANHMNLANLKKAEGQLSEALGHLYVAKEKNDKLFDILSMGSKKLLRIRHQYEKELRQKSIDLAQQQIELAEKKNSLLINRIIIVLGLLIAVIAGSMVYFKNQQIRFNAEKSVIRAKNKLKQQEAKSALELKNKGLTSYTLRFIEKDKIITKLMNYMKKTPPKDKEYSKIVQEVKNMETVRWNDFQKRFIDVNKNFYDRLAKLHPKLTSKDLRLIALLKLNFSGKEIAEMMGISLNSLHISRHRLRKKMDLKLGENLDSYIQSF